MTAYCQTRNCLRAHILRYFGESCPDTCGSCGNCRGAFQEIDVTDQAEAILKAIQTAENRYNTSFGMTVYLKLLRGVKDKTLSAWAMEKLPVFGILARQPEGQLRDLLEQLKLQGILTEERDGAYTVLTLGPAAPEVLDYGQPVRIRQKLQTAPPLQAPPLPPENPELLAALKRLRARLAREANVPAYMIFTNASLEDMARKRPTSLDALLQVNGVGAVKAHRYGHAFLETIRAAVLAGMQN